MRKIFLLGFIIFFASCTNGFALEKTTHRKINEFNAPIINQQLANIGISSGVEDYINGQQIIKWIGDGGEAEDEPLYSRSFNHYLNPINNTGYGGIFKSALEWSHSQGGFGSMFGGDYSWPAVRSYYLNALISPDKATRDNYFTYTFQGVGQLMHLVEDMSVPAHTRNDGHILYNYEDWVEDTRTENPGVFNGLLSSPVYFSGAISTYDSLFLDLAAFSNANFLSNDTIFSGFTYPRIEDTELWTDTTNNRDYLRKLTGIQVDHLAASSWLYFYRLRYFPANNTLLPLGLDNMVYADYAAKLIPRAVGYSAGLINYFFRGQIDMEKDTQNAGKYIIKNLSNEAMSGTFSLYYDDEDDNRNQIDSWNISLSAGGKSAPMEFTEPADAKEKGKYMLVFNGALGSEAGAVAGKVVSLERKRWEDWNVGKYTLERFWYNAYSARKWELFTLETDNLVWNGFVVYFSSKPDVEIENGTLKVHAPTDSWANIGTFAHIPVSGCNLKMKIPYAQVSGDDNVFWMTVGFTNGKISESFRYRIAEKPGYMTDWSFMGIFVGSGDIERDIETDFRTMMNKRNQDYMIGDITNWHIYWVGLSWYALISPGNARGTIDYIDFECNDK